MKCLSFIALPFKLQAETRGAHRAHPGVDNIVLPYVYINHKHIYNRMVAPTLPPTVRSGNMSGSLVFCTSYIIYVFMNTACIYFHVHKVIHCDFLGV